jgi:tetratricopeptide (TPR) repeat protein
MEADTWSLLGSLHQEEGNLPLAVEYYERALALYRALRDQAREAASLANLATIYEAQGLQQQALETKQQAVRLLQPRP